MRDPFYVPGSLEFGGENARTDRIHAWASPWLMASSMVLEYLF
jgi:hypothetical protein